MQCRVKTLVVQQLYLLIHTFIQFAFPSLWNKIKKKNNKNALSHVTNLDYHTSIFHLFSILQNAVATGANYFLLV